MAVMAEQQSRVPVWARDDTRRRTTLSREAIVAAAVAIADVSAEASRGVANVQRWRTSILCFSHSAPNANPSTGIAINTHSISSRSLTLASSP